ncbi:MAG: hypothetical protein U9Q67_02950 [Patescibacteria group bacterium]|nr:hypothetical protein [Patescibacteria group bacterium]
MAKPTKYASIICIALSVISAIGILASLIFYSPMPAIILLIPAVIYEVYRTEGASTKTSSIIVLIVLLFELVLIIFNIDIDIAEFLGQESKYIAGYEVPLGSLTVIGPTIIAILSVILFIRTRGIYTKWLAVIIFVTSFIIIYALNPESLTELLKFGIQEILGRFSYI